MGGVRPEIWTRSPMAPADVEAASQHRLGETVNLRWANLFGQWPIGDVECKVPCGGGLVGELAWTRSSFSLSNGECVEMAALDGETIGVRDSKDPDGAVLRFTREEMLAFVRGVHAGEFDEFC